MGAFASSARVRRACFVGLLAVQALVGLYGIDQPVRWGHQGFHVGEHGLGARNLERFGSFTFTTHHGRGSPPPEALNFHHPTMLQVPVWLVQQLFGDEPWTLRCVGLAFAFLALVSVWQLCRRVRSESHALLAAGVFVLHPLNVAFCNLPDVQIVGIAALLRSGIAWSQVTAKPGWRPAAPFVAWIGVACFADWTATLITGIWLVLALCFPDPSADREERRRRGRVLVLAGLTAGAVLAQHFLRAWANGSLDDLLGAYSGRTLPVSWSAVVGRLLEHQTLPLVVLGVIWLIRRGGRRDPGTAFVLAFFWGQTMHLLRFPNEFMFHEYRSYWYVFPFAFAAADLVEAGGRLGARRGLRWFHPCLVAVSMVFLVSSAVPMLVLSRARSGSTSLEPYDPHTSLYLAARAVRALSPHGTAVFVGPTIEDRPETFWLLDRPSWHVKAAVQVKPPCMVLASATVMTNYRDWRSLARNGRAMLIDTYCILDLRQPGPSVEHAQVVLPRTYGLLLRWLRAPMRGPALLAPGDPGIAAAFARAIEAPPAVVDRALLGDAPLRVRLGPELSRD